MKNLIIKLFVLVSIISLSLITIFYFSNERYIFFISLLSNIIQIILFGVWFFQRERIPKETIMQVKEIYQYATDEREENKRKGKIMAHLMKAGLIPSDEIKKAFKSLKIKEVICVHTYGEGLRQNLINEYGLRRQPLVSILESLGFIRVFRNPTLYIIFKDNLPKELRSLHNLEIFMTSELEKEWEKISKFTKKKYPQSKYKIYEKYREKTGFKCSYVLLKSIEDECIIGYKNRYSFTPEFVERIMGEYQKSKKVLSSFEIKRFVLNLRMNLLMDELPKQMEKILLKNEDNIKTNLNIKHFFEFKNKSLIEIKESLKNYIKLEDLDFVSNSLKEESKSYYEVLKELGFIQ